MRPSNRIASLLLAATAALAAGTPAAAQQVGASASLARASVAPAPLTADQVLALDAALAADSMEGRGTATAGGARAARWIAEQLRAFGVRPAGDSGYFQHVPLAAVVLPDGRTRLRLLPALADDSVPAARRRRAVNVVGVVPGADPVLRDEVVLFDAHYDHLGIGRPVGGDSIYNGADDDASGTVAVLAIARALAGGPAPKRTVVILLTTGEEVGLLGTRWYLAHPVTPLERMVANLEIEMIARPDSAAGGEGRAWLTGFDRSTMGSMLAAAGLPVVADPRPWEHFFERSDNIAFAKRGIPAHTLSSYGMHGDYHTPADEAGRVDAAHMARVVDAAVRAARLLADGPAPRWVPGGAP